MKVKVTISTKVEDAILALHPNTKENTPDKQHIRDIIAKLLTSKLDAYATRVAIQGRDVATGNDVEVTEIV